MKGHCIKSLKLLLSCNIDNLHDDCFEGSVDESHIFRDVFFNHEDTNQNDNWSPKYISFRSDSDNSVMTSQLDSLQCTTSEEFASFTRNDPDVEVKKIKVSLSPLEHSITIPIKIPKPRWKDSSFIELEKDELTLPPNNSTMDPKPILRYYTYTLLKSSGWLIGRRNRTTHCKGRGEYVFKSPEGRPIREFYRAWNMCGQTLVKDADYKTLRDDINWKDLTQFQSDLSFALTKVKELVDSVIVTDLAHSWYLLDPFAKLVFIDKRLSLLKEGKEVKAKRSLVNGLYSKNKKPKKEKKEKCCIKDDDLLMSAIFTRKRNRSTLTKKNSPVLKVVKKYNNALGVTTVLSWLIKLGVIHVNEVIEYRDPHDDTVVKHGLVKQNGILCGCCKKLLCVSEFKNHVNFSIENTSLNLFMQSGKSFTLCQLEAWSTEYKVRKNATRTVQVAVDHFDDSCGLCGDGGELVCCDNCPSTFHQTCLSTQELPEGNWYCSNCCCWSCGDVISHIEASESYHSLKCLQCEHKYHLECVEENGIEGGSVGPTWFCGETCKKIHWSLRSQIGCRNPLSDGFSWTLLKCIHGDQKVNSNPAFIALKAECNLKLAVALTIMEECFLPMVDTRTGIYMIPHVVYNWGSEFVRLNYEGFYTMVLEKNDILLCVASIRIHGTTVAEMPLIGTCTKYRRQGMCRRLMNAIEQMLKLFKVETLVVSAIPSLVDTWTGGFGFLRLEDDEKKSLGKTNLMVFPGTVWLKKPMYQDILTGMSSSSHKT